VTYPSFVLGSKLSSVVLQQTMATLPRIDTALADCAALLAAVRECDPAIDTAAVEAYLARHLVVLLCAEVETAVNAALLERVDAAVTDVDVRNLIASVRRGVVRSAKHRDIGEALAKLSDEVKRTYDAAVVSAVGEAGIARLGNAVQARDNSAHSAPPNITIGDVAEAAKVAAEAVSCARTAMGLA
jgi:hypothetical protein